MKCRRVVVALSSRCRRDDPKSTFVLDPFFPVSRAFSCQDCYITSSLVSSIRCCRDFIQFDCCVFLGGVEGARHRGRSRRCFVVVSAYTKTTVGSPPARETSI